MSDTTIPSSMALAPDRVLEGIQAYCSEQKIHISPAIVPRRVSGRGIGVYSTRTIKKGQRLMTVPSKALVTTRLIPTDFFKREEYGPSKHDKASASSKTPKIAVHAQLAAWLAFEGDRLHKYQRWLDTWPTWDDFIAGMPIFWGHELSSMLFLSQPNPVCNHESKHCSKRRRTESESRRNGSFSNNKNDSIDSTQALKNSYLILSPTLNGHWDRSSPTLPPEGHPQSISSTPRTHLLSHMRLKLQSHINSLLPYFPHLKEEESLRKFLYAWSAVNTRCFYYLHPGQSHPSDSNEAMALVPAMDLFNHTSEENTPRVKFTHRGFTITAMRDYDADEEIYLSYGLHSEDTLWVEYGFILGDEPPVLRETNEKVHHDNAEAPEHYDSGRAEKQEVTYNKFDSVPLDDIILASLTPTEHSILSAHEYLGKYTLRCGEICYRTEIAAWLKVLGKETWIRMVEGAYDPEQDSEDGKKLQEKMHVCVKSWMKEVQNAAEENIRTLESLSHEELRLHLGSSVIEPDSLVRAESEDGEMMQKLEMAERRRDMCLKRWRQIYSLADSVLQSC